MQLSRLNAKHGTLVGTDLPLYIFAHKTRSALFDELTLVGNLAEKLAGNIIRCVGTSLPLCTTLLFCHSPLVGTVACNKSEMKDGDLFQHESFGI